MNSFMKAKKEEKKSSNCETTVKPTEKKEEPKTSSGFTYKDFQKSINKKESDTKTSIPAQTNSNSSLTVEKRNDEKLTKEELKKEKEKEVEKKKEKEKKTKDDYEEEIESEIESDSDSDIEFESDDDEDDDGYKIVEITLIPFIFTEKYDQVKGFIKDSRITCYSFLNVINNGFMSDNENKEIENRIKDRLSKILFVDNENIKLKLNKNNDSRFYFVCYVKIYGDSFTESLYDDDKNQIIKCAKRKYQKHYKDIYKKEYDAEEDFFDYFKYLEDFLNIYFKIIYGCTYCANEISNVINAYFTDNRVNPFTYNENIIPFREIRTKSKDVIKTTIMKIGFIFDDVKEIKKDKD